MPRCVGYKPTGDQCAHIVDASQTYCYAHDPARKEQRSANASKAARSKGPAAELVELRALVRRYMDDVEKGKLDKGKGAVLAQLAGVAGRLYESEARIRELLEVRIPEFKELRAELSELKEAFAQNDASNGARRRGSWGA